MAEKKKTFEQAMIRLEEIVTQLEKGEAPLEESLKLFEEGMTLMSSVPHCWTRRSRRCPSSPSGQTEDR